MVQFLLYNLKKATIGQLPRLSPRGGRSSEAGRVAPDTLRIDDTRRWHRCENLLDLWLVDVAVLVQPQAHTHQVLWEVDVFEFHLVVLHQARLVRTRLSRVACVPYNI